MGLSTALELELAYPSSLKMPVPNERGWSGVTLPWMSIGYELKMTPLHMLTFYNAIANKGKMMKPIFTTKIFSDGKLLSEIKPIVINPAICSKTTINKIIPLLIGVIDQGTARNIKSDKYKIAGKTGTTVLNYAGRKKDEKKKYQASFVGFFPAHSPKYSCVVVINNPREKNMYGGKVAAPIFKELADKVFSLDIDIHNPILLSEDSIPIPIIKYGDIDYTNIVLNRLGFTDLQYSVDKQESFKNKIEEDLDNSIMPNLKGMNLKDALFIMERYGIQIIISGSGSIINQSIQSGEHISKETLVKLELA